MKKLLLTPAFFFFCLILNAQSISGKWSFEKMNFFGNIIYYDDSPKDKENLVDSWIKMNGVKDDEDMKNEVKKSADRIYAIAKKMFKSSIEFKEMELDLILEWTTGKLIYNDQDADDNDKIKKTEVDIRLKYYERSGYSIMTFPLYGDFHSNEKLKVFSKTDKLVLEAVPAPAANITGAFIVYYGKGKEAVKSGSVNSYIANVEIGDQTWMQKNLDTDRFRNGDRIPQARTAAEWKAATEDQTPAWCYVEYDAGNNNKFGKLYNYYCVADERGLAPEGWHVPSLAEARVLINELGGDRTAAHALRSTTGWRDNAKSTNESGFSAYGAGKCWTDGSFMEKNFSAYFATTTKNAPDKQGNYQVNYFLVQQTSGTVFNSHSTTRGTGISVRCIKD